EFLKELREALGLGRDSQPREIIEALRDKCASAERQLSLDAANPDPARYVGVADYERALTELNSLKAEQAHERASHAVEEAIRAGRLVPAQREWATAYCVGDANGFRAFIAKQPSIIGGETRIPGASNDKRTIALSATEIAICAQLGLKHADF